MAVMTHDPAVATAGSITEAAEQALRRGERLLAAVRAALTKLSLALDEREHLTTGQLRLWEIPALPADSAHSAEDAQTIRDQNLADATASVETLLRGEGGA